MNSIGHLELQWDVVAAVNWLCLRTNPEHPWYSQSPYKNVSRMLAISNCHSRHTWRMLVIFP